MKRFSFYLALTLIPASLVYAGTMGEMGEAHSPQRYFIAVGSGISFANKANPSIDYSLWSDAIEGYSDSLRDAPLYTAALGYTINDAINVDLSYTFRGLYSYAKYQTVPTSTTGEPPLPSRSRYFDLSSNAVMFDVTLDGGVYHALAYNTADHGFIQPFIGAGLGVSYNTLSNFHTILANTNVTTSTALDQTTISLAYQFNAGLEWVYERFSFDIGYRYFNAGRYQSNNYLVTNYTEATQTSTVASPKTTVPWKDTLSTNELFFTARVAF
ncbi:MAG: outer membrane beta-barrel protein [Gammaproteobacteria bacterium]|nr:outer membrane beta-barrel protein [Gammaproteobacteria bacterium]